MQNAHKLLPEYFLCVGQVFWKDQGCFTDLGNPTVYCMQAELGVILASNKKCQKHW